MKSKIVENQDGTMRALSNRHVQMIAIGGTIGTGLFLGSGSTISKTGPSIMLVYLTLGLFFFFMMRAIPHSILLFHLFHGIWAQL